MIEPGSIRRRTFMGTVMRFGITMLAGAAVHAGGPGAGSRCEENAGLRRLVREYGAEFGGKAALRGE
jgi:hypothetical protein